MKERIDWRNHFVAFLSTLLGIYIAFQLEDWREDRDERQRVEITLNSIKAEIQNDLSIYEVNINKISDFLEYVDFIQKHNDGSGHLIFKESDLNYHKAKNPSRFEDVHFIKVFNDSLNIYSSSLVVDFVPVTGISTNHWVAAKSSGILNYVDHSKVATLTLIYEWIDKDLGFNDSEFYSIFLESDQTFPNLDKMIVDYKRLLNIYKFKMDKIEKQLKAIDWNEPVN